MSLELKESDIVDLKAQISKELVSITETDPDMLADYVVALLRHQKPADQLKKDCQEQLYYFLKSETDSFVNKLFGMLERRSSSNQKPQQSNEHRYARDRQYYTSSMQNSGEDNARSRADMMSSREYRRETEYRQNSRTYNDSRDYEGRYGRRSSVEEYRNGKHSATGYERERRRSRSPDEVTKYQKRDYGSESSSSNRTKSERNQFTRNRKPIIPSQQLAVLNIPPEHCNEEAVRGFFQQFGTITRIVLFPREGRAVLDYASILEAQSAFNTSLAPFGLRNIRIYYQRALGSVSESAPVEKPAEDIDQKQNLNLLKEKLREKLQELQKAQSMQRLEIVAKLDKVSSEDRAEIIGSLAQISQKISAVAKPNAVPVPSSVQNPLVDLVAKSGKSSNATEDLRMKLETLKKVHGSLGLSDRSGAKFSRAPRSFKLDLRPRQLRAEGISDSIKSHLKAHFEQFGAVEHIEQGEHSAIVKYKERWSAEKAFKFASKDSDGSSLMTLTWSSDPVTPTQIESHCPETANDEDDEEGDKSWKR